MVVNEPCSRGDQGERGEKQEIRRVADVHDIDTVPEADAESQAELR